MRACAASARASYITGVRLRRRITLCATNRVGGVLAGDFFWIFRGFTDCATALIFAQETGRAVAPIGAVAGGCEDDRLL